VGLAGETNVQGEEQKKLDVLSNDIMVNALRASGKTAVLVSEEIEEAIIIEERNRGKYCVVFDPLDGSSNIDAGVNIGTIFGVYKIVCTFHLLMQTGLLAKRFFVATRFKRLVGRCIKTWSRNGCCWLYHVTMPRAGSIQIDDLISFIHRYGSSANLVLSTGSGVNGYTLDAALGEFILTHPDVSNLLFSLSIHAHFPM
jgi:fructose-1,6-bisphosphatase I